MENGISKRAAATGRHAEAPEEQALPGLPAGWVWTTLEEFLGEGTVTIIPQRFPDRWFELYSVPSYDTGVPEIVQGSDIGSNKQMVSAGTVLLCKINPKINRVWVVRARTSHEIIASTEWIPFGPLDETTASYLAYYMRNPAFRHFLAANVSGVGGSLMRVRPTAVKRYPIPLPPLPEQRRIVTALEEQFSRLDAGVAALERVRAALKRYRAAVLQAACTGRLVPTEAELARAEGRDYETAGRLLARIRAERRSRWEAEQRAKLAATGKPPRNDAWKSKYQEPAPPDTRDLPELPEGWIAITLGEIVRPSRMKANPQEHQSLPFVGLEHVEPHTMRLLGTVPSGAMKSSAFRFRPGDILYGRLRPYLNKVCRPEMDGLCSAEFIVFPIGTRLDARFLQYLLNSSAFVSFASHLNEGDRPRVDFAQIAPYRVYLPPLAEQERIVAEVERRLSVVEELEAVVDANLKRAGRLRQAILKRAFEGRLVPQDPNDEPAGLLLERLRGEREDSTEGPMGGDRKTRLARSRRSKAR